MDKTRQIKEGVTHQIPQRKAMRGRKVTVHTRELGGPKGRKFLGEDQNPFGKNLDEEDMVLEQGEKELSK